jgi:flagellar hook-associated protein 2
MAGISSPGIGSGLDINGLVSKLVAAEGQPVTQRLDKREAGLQAELSAYGSLKGALSSFQSSVIGLTGIGSFSQRSATSSNTDLFSVSASTGAAAGSHSVEVKQLAQAQKLASAGFTDANSAIGTGTLTFQFGDPTKPAKTITIDANNNTLEGIRDAVNKTDIGVSAAIVNGDAGYQLVFSAKKSGADNALKITVNENPLAGNNTDMSGLSQLAYDPAAVVGSGQNMTQVAAAQDAQAVINGITVSRATNTINDAVDGVTFTLKKADVGTTASATIALNTASVSDAIKGFVTGYNKLASTIGGLGNYNAETKKGGVLLGDSALRGVTSQLRSVLGSVVYGMNDGVRSLSDIGIKTQADGTLKVDDALLQKAITNNFDHIGRLFTAMGTATDSGVSYHSATSATQVGTYAVGVTQLATRGSYVDTASAISSLVVDSTNDTFSIKVNGTSSGTLNITPGTYTSGDELAAELQSRINGDSALQAANASVTVAYDVATNRFSFTSERYGSSSSVEILSVKDTALSGALGLTANAAAKAAGVDVAGSIGGKDASGAGQYLSGAGNAEGLKLQIEGSTVGGRGSVDFSRGIADKLNSLLKDLVSKDGFLSSRTDALGKQVTEISQEREVLSRRLATIEARYMKQFIALDTLMSQMQSMSEYLAGQLASLPGMSSNR